ncbi:hypothetical protein [Azospirillum soli]|nr:hypothetical protein [Azospirillum soli]MBP2311793.1 hypothetical protein [Azospirillum soli]
MTDEFKPGSTLKRWLWFIGLWAAGVGTTGAVSLGIKFWLT